jgi:hypothetical protein
MPSELTKKEKKIARELIAKGLQVDLKKGLENFAAILKKGSSDANDIKDHYNSFCNEVKDFDKFVTQRYDYMRGSEYLTTIAVQLRDELLDESELEAFDNNTKEQILSNLNFMRKYAG